MREEAEDGSDEMPAVKASLPPHSLKDPYFKDSFIVHFAMCGARTVWTTLVNRASLSNLRKFPHFVLLLTIIGLKFLHYFFLHMHDRWVCYGWLNLKKMHAISFICWFFSFSLAAGCRKTHEEQRFR